MNKAWVEAILNDEDGDGGFVQSTMNMRKVCSLNLFKRFLIENLKVSFSLVWALTSRLCFYLSIFELHRLQHPFGYFSGSFLHRANLSRNKQKCFIHFVQTIFSECRLNFTINCFWPSMFDICLWQATKKRKKVYDNHFSFRALCWRHQLGKRVKRRESSHSVSMLTE